MQKRKNIRLLIIFAAFIMLTLATYFLVNNDQQAVVDNAVLFAVEDVSQIDSVVFHKKDTVQTLQYKNNDWLINNSHAADPQKLTVLFAILNQVRARRPVADAQEQYMDSLFNATGSKVQFYEGKHLVQEFEVAGVQETGLTYFRKEEGAYIVNIPGYRSYLAAIFNMSTSDWRNKLIYEEVSWNNLEKVEVDFPASDQKGFTILPERDYYSIDGLIATDSLKLLDYLDRISLLMAQEYLEEVQRKDSIKDTAPLINIAITDIRNRPFQLRIFAADGLSHIALKDSAQWLLISKDQVEPLIRSRAFFKAE